ncbi:MAG: glycosyltransferase family 2 protein, partial [Bacillota bacterium]|nr:glycosyltransferase family 2 protein [Bacillota bacterium]
MKLSIITVNLNNCDGLKKTIESVIAQTFTDFEWIVIDGGSTDGSKELIEQNSGNLAYWISEKDNGVYNAMNKGVYHAAGSYILFLNSGDYLTDNSVLETVFSNEYDSDILYGDIIICDGANIIERRAYDDILSFSYLLKWSIGHPSSFIKRQLLIDFPYNESYKIVSDKEFFLKQALWGASFQHVPCYV